jgi:hypothetical protein
VPVAGAEVVIFPGVRIERREFSLSDRIAPARKRRSGRAETAAGDFGSEA